MSEISDIDLLKELGVELEVEKPKQYSPLEARLIAGFEDIQKFVAEHGRAPQHGEDNDIFERLYAVRLDQLRKNEQALTLLTSLDADGLLAGKAPKVDEDIADDALLAELGVEVRDDNADDITKLRHVSPIAHRQAADEIANREVCRDFEKFEPLFEQVQLDLKAGTRKSRSGINREDIVSGTTFILNGQMLYIADKGEEFLSPNGTAWDARLRMIFDNGTESNMLMRSLLRRGVDDKLARTISNPEAGPLFVDITDENNQTGTIYVLRSKSNLPEITPLKNAILKIGVTGDEVKRRIANAQNEATYLLGDVEIVDEYKLYNINRVKLERLLQRIFHDARLIITIKDRFGKPVKPREWFMVTREAVAEAVKLIQAGEIKNFQYDITLAKFIKRTS
jgi:hypothetical protein